MSAFAARIIKKLSSGDPNEVRDAILEAMFLFEKAHPANIGLSFQQQEERGWTPAVIAATPTKKTTNSLRPAMISIVDMSPPSPHLGSALFALGKLEDRTLLPVFVQALRQTLDDNNDALFQAVIALYNLREDVFGGARSMLGLNIEENRRLARAYLMK